MAKLRITILILTLQFGLPAVAQQPLDLEEIATEISQFDETDFINNSGLYRQLNGRDNNVNETLLGSTGSQLRRLLPPEYADGIAAMAGPQRPNPRDISNVVMHQQTQAKIKQQKSAWLWQWGQFIDHDLDFTPNAMPAEPEFIAVPWGDPFFDPESTGAVTIDFFRSQYDINTGTGLNNPREQLNEITAWIDASNVYGSSVERAMALRELDGTGKLKVSPGELLPFNDDGLPNDGGTEAHLFIAGDLRANEQIGLSSLHTLFVREHNRLAEQFNQQGIFGDEAYQKSRKLVGAFMQSITYNEFLPSLLGNANSLPDYSGYDSSIDAQIANEFSTAAFRFGHSMLNPILLRLDDQFSEVPWGHVPLHLAFFAPQKITDEGGIDPILRGLTAQVAFDIDNQIISAVRNFLFGQPGEGGLDLAALNIQRGRDHGLPSYNSMRAFFGLNTLSSFQQFNASAEIRNKLQSIYNNVNDIDLWVGGITENHVPGGHVGELFSLIIIDQFTRSRDGDRFWYESQFSGNALTKIRNTRLADIVVRNTNLNYSKMGRDVFKVAAKPRN